eukprot:5424703-Prymnesium_polylepis.1
MARSLTQYESIRSARWPKVTCTATALSSSMRRPPSGVSPCSNAASRAATVRSRGPWVAMILPWTGMRETFVRWRWAWSARKLPAWCWTTFQTFKLDTWNTRRGTTGRAGRHGAPSGQAGTYPQVGE